MKALSQNGEILFIDRPVELLATDGRPLSQGGLERLLSMREKRLPLYQKYAAHSVDNSGSVEEAIKAAMEGFYEAADH